MTYYKDLTLEKYVAIANLTVFNAQHLDQSNVTYVMREHIGINIQGTVRNAIQPHTSYLANIAII